MPTHMETISGLEKDHCQKFFFVLIFKIMLFFYKFVFLLMILKYKNLFFELKLQVENI